MCSASHPIKWKSGEERTEPKNGNSVESSTEISVLHGGKFIVADSPSTFMGQFLVGIWKEWHQKTRIPHEQEKFQFCEVRISIIEGTQELCCGAISSQRKTMQRESLPIKAEIWEKKS
jgi:hypothetical protein